MVPASSALGVNALDNVENVASGDARPTGRDPLAVLASYKPDLPSENSDNETNIASDIDSEPALTENKARHPLSSRKPTRLAPLHETAVMGLALVGLVAGYTAWRLSEGTISIAAATPLVEDALERVIGGQTKIGSLRLGWDKDARNFVVTATQITATTDARTSPLTLGQVNLTLNAQALLLGQTQISRADISGLQAVLVLDKEGRTAFGFGTPEEVLALPRKKAATKGLRPLLDSVRQAVLRNDNNGRVEAIGLRNAVLVVIDPDSGERLTLADARASITTDTEGIVTMQAAGFAREMGGFGNVAVSSSPDPKQRLALAVRFENGQLSKLPSSLRVGPLARVANDSAPLTGRALVRLGVNAQTTDVDASVSAGAGWVQGFALTTGSGNLEWRGSQNELVFSNVMASGRQGRVEAANGRIATLENGNRAISLDVRSFNSASPTFGTLSGEGLRGAGQIDADNNPVSGSLTGRNLRFDQQDQTSIRASDFGFVLSAPRRDRPNVLQATLTTGNLQGIVDGQNVGARNLNVTLDATRDGIALSLNQVTANAAQFQYGVDLGGLKQSFDGAGLVLSASDFSSRGNGRLSLPSVVSIRAAQLAFGRGQASPLTGSASGLNLVANNIMSGRAQFKGTITQLDTRSSVATIPAASGQAIAFDISQTASTTGRINSLQATAFMIAAGPTSVATNNLAASGNYTSKGLSGTVLAASNVEVRNELALVRPFWADDLRVSGDFTTRSAKLDAFSLRHRGVNISGTTQIALAPRGSASVKLNADVRGAFSVETLLSAWPRRFLPDTRSAIQRLIPSGTAEVSRLELDIPAGMIRKEILPKNGMTLDFSLRDIVVTYLGGMSPITNVSGEGQLLGDSLFIDLEQGQIGDLALTQGSVDIAQFKPTGAQLAVGAKVTGDVSAMATEIDLPPLALLTKAGLSPDRLSGTGTATLGLNIPLKPALQADDIGVTVAGDFQQAGLTRTFAGLDAYGGNVRLGVANRKIEVDGTARLAGNLFDFAWANDPAAPLGSQVRLTANGEVTVDSLRALGVDANAYATGPFRLNIASNSQGSQFGEAVVNADFRNTNITLPGKAWAKSEGVEALGSARLYPREGGGWNVQDLRFNSAGASLRGALDISDAGNLVDARFSRVVIDNAADLSVDVTPGADALIVTMRGAYLNLGPYLDQKNVSEKAVDLLDRPLTLNADIALVATGPGRELTNVHADIVRDRDGWRTLEAAGSAPAGRSQVSLSVQRDGRRTISGVLSDAGFFAQLLYPGAPIFGGTGTIEGELPVVGANSSGNLTFTGKDIQLVRNGSSPVIFDNVQLPMSVRGGVVTLRDGQADGVAYTVKASGYVDVGAGRLDIRGVATPGGLNRVLADIPLFGAILGGGADEGLLGMTFRARGLMTAPRLQTNPISALAPGFLRKLFESEAPLSPQPRLVAVPFTGIPVVEKWPYGPTEDMSERPNAQGGAAGPTW
jgi:hypothetical protein